MNSIRYFLALLLVIGLPVMLLFWLLIHSFVPTWRRLGPVWTYSLVGMLVMLTLFGLFQARTLLLTVEFGSHAPLWLWGSGCLAMAVYLRRLIDILTIAIGAVIAGADSWVAVERFGYAKVAWLQPFLELPNGIPSHDTFGRVVAALNPIAFAECFQHWR